MKRPSAATGNDVTSVVGLPSRDVDDGPRAVATVERREAAHWEPWWSKVRAGRLLVEALLSGFFHTL
jgi:hypothetical protein